jgi:hypothetical protein
VSKQGEAGWQLARDLSKMINNMNSEEDEQAFVEEVMRDHRTLQQKIARLFLQCFVEWSKSYDKNYYDLRNQKTSEIASGITKMLEEDHYYAIINGQVKLPYI